MSKKQIDYTDPNFSPATLVQLLRWRALTEPDKIAYTYLKDGEKKEIRLSYGELDRRARAIAASLMSKGLTGERALLLYPPGLDYISGFFGCLYAGVIAVPAYPPDPNRLNRSLPRLQAIVNDAGATVALTSDSILYMIQMLKLGNKLTSALEKVPFMRKFQTSMKYFSSGRRAVAESRELGDLQWLSTDGIASGLAEGWKEPRIDSETISFLQYTSGSTGNPKGVILTHSNLLANSKIIYEELGYKKNTVGVFWLPIYHDMGLIGGVLHPLYSGCPSLLMSPIAFLQRPLRWLNAISRLPEEFVAGSAAHNFAYDLCVKKATPEKIAQLDLSRWEMALSGAEPVRAQTIERFSEVFKPAGFRKEAFFPAYGLAEATLLVTGSELYKPPVTLTVDKAALKKNSVIKVPEDDPNSQTLVSSGHNPKGQKTIIVNTETFLECKPGDIGEIWVKGPSVSRGYYKREEATKETFQNYLADSGDGPYLRTGDLGFIIDDNLFVAGRVKDLIIVRGTNHYPQDIELTVEESHPALRKGCSAAFTIDEGATEQLVVVAEVRQSKNLPFDEIIDAIRQAVTLNHDLQTSAVVLIKARSILKTSSGKIMRRATKSAYLDEKLAVVARWQMAGSDLTVPPKTEEEQTVAPPPAALAAKSEQVKAIEKWLVDQLSASLGMPAKEIDLHQPFASFGLDSAQAVGLAGDLEEWLNRTLPPTLIWDYPTIEALAFYLASEETGVAPTARVSRKRTAEYEPIAIIGLGSRFPGANNTREFWQLLKNGVDGISEVPPNRWDADRYYDPDPAKPGKMITKEGGFVDQVDMFDADFFGISPREAGQVDPQQRLLLEVSWEALESAGLPYEKVADTRTGVFIGISSNDYSRLQMGAIASLNPYSGTGNAFSIASNRISYFYNFHGPSMSIDTACSSSLVSVHNACQSLRDGDCDLALAGGVNLILSPEVTITFSQARMMSADGRCKTFDASADGYGRGEGAGLVVLKRLSEAVKDGDNILAVIRGSAVNQDGRSNGLTAPNSLAQQAVINDALENADLAPDEIQYLETHGTGTPLGDPIEIESIKKTMLQERSKEKPLYIGSVKTNIGHLESAAGVAGLIKTVLSLKNEEIPSHLHFKKLNPYIKLDDVPIKVVTENLPWPHADRKRYAAISAFGFGGTNAHLILEEAPEKTARANPAERKEHVFTLSAKNEAALSEYAGNLFSYFNENPQLSIGDVCYTMNSRRTHFEQRAAAVVHDLNDLSEKLTAIKNNEENEDIFVRTNNRTSPPKIAFLFTGQGAQYVNMGKNLYETQPTFRAAMNRCSAISAEYLPEPLLSVIFPEDENSARINETQYTQPALFAVEYALAKLWQSWGVQPDVLIGHSVGEYVAAVISGVFSLEEGMKLISARGRLMQSLPQNGAMAAIFAQRSEVEKALSGLEDKISLAGVNGPSNTVISGEKAAVRQVAGQFEGQNIKVTYLTVSHAFHSPLMDPILDEFETIAKEVDYRLPQIPIVSNLSGKLLDDLQIPDAAYWRAHIRQAVLFDDGMKTLSAENVDIFLETGPHPTLLGMGRHCLPESEAVWLPSLNRKKEDWPVLLNSVAALFVNNASINWEAFDKEYNRNLLPLPGYPFQRKRYWFEDAEETPESVSMAGLPAAFKYVRHRLLGRRLQSPALKNRVFEAFISMKSVQELSDPRIMNMALLPATGFIEMCLAAAREYDGEHLSVLRDFKINAPLKLPEEGIGSLQTILTPAENDADGLKIKIYSQFTDADSDEDEHFSEWVLHASAHVLTSDQTTENSTESPEEILTRCTETIKAEPFYAELNGQGFDYGPVFRSLREIHSGQGEALGKIELPEKAQTTNTFYHFHPALLDAGFQLLAAILPRNLQNQAEQFIYLPDGMEEFVLFEEPTQPLWAHITLNSHLSDQNSLSADLQFFGEDGKLLAVAKKLHLSRTRKSTLMALLDSESSKWLYRLQWESQAPSAEKVDLSGRWLLFMDETQQGRLLKEEIEKNSGSVITVLPAEQFAREEQSWKIRADFTEDYRRLLSEIEQETSEPLRGIVHLWSIAAQAQDDWSADKLMEAQKFSTESVLYLLQTLAAPGRSNMPRLWLVTNQSQMVHAGDRPNPANAPLWGLGKVIVLDHPDVSCVRVDINLQKADGLWPALAAELAESGQEDQVALRANQRFVARLTQVNDDLSAAQQTSEQLVIEQKGMLDNLQMKPMQRIPPGTGQVEIRVQATGLNFRDVLNALDLYPGDPGPLGGECAGAVVAVGPEVTHLQVGDEVIAIAAGSFADYVTTYADLAVKKPQNISFAEAATIPITFLTAYYALYRLANLDEGERVFIHVASGGVGQAAIQLAKLKNAEIFATAGSDEKRAFLRNQGIKHVMNSRSLDFADEVMQITNGEGVNVLLNSLTDDYIPKGLSILQTGGRFLEIGKVGIWDAEKMQAKRPDVAYHAIALDDLSKEQPELIQSMFRELMELFASGRLQPLPLRTYAIEDALSAFRYMQQAKHIGKVVITQDVSKNEVQVPSLSIRPEAVYLITGGAGALGLTVAEWLVRNGAKHIALTGRHEPQGNALERINTLKQKGAQVSFKTADVSDFEQVNALIKTYGSQNGNALGGIIHAAGVLDDGHLLQQTRERFQKVFRPKMHGAWNLHRATAGMDLDFVVYFSSMASLLGSPGQGNYAAANAFLDSLAQYRATLKQPAVSINWGPWSGSGMAADTDPALKRFRNGLGAILPEQGLALLDKILQTSEVNMAVLPIRWKAFLKRFEGFDVPAVLRNFSVSQGAQPAAEAEKPELVLQLEEAEPENRRQIITGFLRKRTAKILGLENDSSLDIKKPLSEMGLDSLMAIEMKNALDRAIGKKLPATMVFNYPTIEALTGYLLTDVLSFGSGTEEPEEEAKESKEDQLDKTIDEIENLSDEEAEALLLQKLEEDMDDSGESDEDIL